MPGLVAAALRRVHDPDSSVRAAPLGGVGRGGADVGGSVVRGSGGGRKRGLREPARAEADVLRARQKASLACARVARGPAAPLYEARLLRRAHLRGLRRRCHGRRHRCRTKVEAEATARPAPAPAEAEA